MLYMFEPMKCIADVRVHACVRMSACVRVRAYKLACLCVHARACECVKMRACVRVYMLACLRTCDCVRVLLMCALSVRKDGRFGLHA
jgi:hypothetical protein